MPHSSKRSGFTLLELAIVLIIIGLVVGGVIVGASLIHSTKLQTAVSDYQRYANAIKLFKEKYHELPGDLPNTPSSWSATNGNGDSFIGDNSLAAAAAQTANQEPLLAWQHLSSSGFVDGAYTGAVVSGNLSVGTNVPKGALDGSAYYIRYAAPNSTTASYEARYGHTIIIGKVASSATMTDDTTSPPTDGIFTPIDAETVDKKIDDGKPGMGDVLAFKATDCVTTNVETTALYKVDTDSPACALIFITGL